MFLTSRFLLLLSTIVISISLTAQSNILAHGPTGYTDDIVEQADGKVLITGNFLGYNGMPMNGIARVNYDGSIDPSFDPGTGIDFLSTPPPYGLAGTHGRTITIQADDRILIGGSFSSFNGNPVGNVVRLMPDGSIDPSFNMGSGFNDIVYSIKVLPNGQLLVGGAFDLYDGTPVSGLVKLNSNGSLDPNFQSPGTSLVFDIEIAGNGSIITCGDPLVQRLNPDGSLDLILSDVSNVASYGYGKQSILLQADGKVIMAGGIFAVNNIPPYQNAYTAVGLVRFNVDGTGDSTFDAQITAPPLTPQINDIEAGSNGQFYAAGAFGVSTPSTSWPYKRFLVRFDSNGVLDDTFPGNPYNGNNSVAVTQNGEVYFSNRNLLQRINSNDEVDSNFNVSTHSVNTYTLDNASPDQDQEEATNGNIYSNAGNLDLVFDSELPWHWRGDQSIAIRYDSIMLAPGAQVEQAFLQFTAAGIDLGACTLTIAAQAHDNAPVIGWQPYDISSRALTSNTATWAPPAWDQLDASGSAQRSVNIAPLIQELVDRPGWNMGNAVLLIINGSGGRQGYSSNKDQSKAATLTIGTTALAVVGCLGYPGGLHAPGGGCYASDSSGLFYSYYNSNCECLRQDCAGVPGGTATYDDCGICNGNNDCLAIETCAATIDNSNFGPRLLEEAENGEVYNNAGLWDLVYDSEPWHWRGNQKIGLAFHQIDMPQGAQITSAHIQFRASDLSAASVQNGPCSLTLWAQDSDNAPQLGWGHYDVSQRPKTNASANWSPATWYQDQMGLAQLTPDLATIVQEIADKAAWQSGNSMVFLVEGSGQRTAQKYAELCIRYQVPGPDQQATELRVPIKPEPSMLVHPNPNRGQQLYVRFDALPQGEQEVQLELFDLSGRSVRSSTQTIYDKDLIMDLQGVTTKGIYILQARIGDTRLLERLIIN